MTSLKVHLPNPFQHDVDGVPVRINVRDVTLDHIATLFVPFGSSQDVNVDPGTYVIEAQLPSGQSTQQVVSVNQDQIADVEMQTAKLSPHDYHAWAYLNKSATHQLQRSLQNLVFEGAWVRLWRKDNGAHWQTMVSELEDGSTWDDDGVNYRLNAFGGMQMLQVGGPGVPWKFVVLPGAQALRVLIRPANGPTDDVHPLDIVVSTNNTGAEAILSMLNSGAIDEAKAMENAGAAEMMLYSKRVDPTAAAIAGYYLLKSDELQRLHDWTKNLANWIDWMADGAIIHAWFLLKAVRYQGGDPIEAQLKARTLLLEAVERGVPIYTEGLRLLRDGINIMCNDLADTAAREAKAIVDAYTQSCDWSAPLTTFLGSEPDKPSPQPMTGKPESLTDLVFLYNVDTEELVRQGIVSVGSTLTLDRLADVPLEVLVEEGGELNLNGNRFKRLQEVADSVGLPETLQYDWQSSDSGESMSEEMANLRHGRFRVLEKIIHPIER